MSNIIRVLLVILCFASFNSFADKDKSKGAIINLTQQSSIEVENDLLVTEIKFSSKDKDSALLQTKINEVINKAFKEIENYKDIELTTKRYSVYQRYEANKESSKEEWMGEQSITIMSQNKDHILELTGKLQKLGMTVNSLQYQLSDSKREEVYNSLIEPTINKLKEKAKKIAKSLDKEEFEFISMNIDSQFIMPNDTVMYKMRGMENDIVSTPVAAAGKTTVTVTVNAQILVKD
ncbi:MAG: SIMPL domain-containing protein [Rickettsiaceae bacterium]|nr:SIMPL domain-containing protein [Rickettsiaceae bacterium]